VSCASRRRHGAGARGSGEPSSTTARPQHGNRRASRWAVRQAGGHRSARQLTALSLTNLPPRRTVGESGPSSASTLYRLVHGCRAALFMAFYHPGRVDRAEFKCVPAVNAGDGYPGRGRRARRCDGLRSRPCARAVHGLSCCWHFPRPDPRWLSLRFVLGQRRG
jgi:hypothetical protein